RAVVARTCAGPGWGGGTRTWGHGVTPCDLRVAVCPHGRGRVSPPPCVPPTPCPPVSPPCPPVPPRAPRPPRSDYIIKEKTVLLQKKDNEGFAFVLRGAKAQTPIEEFTPTPAFPALQYLESVDEGGVAWRAGLRMGDFLIEVNGQNVVKVGHRQVVNMIRQGGNSLVVKVVMVTRHPEAPEGPRRRAAPPQPRRLPAPAISLRSKSMTSELEEMEYDPSSATEKKRTVYQMALNKLDEILAAAQQSISAGEGPGAPLPPLGKTRPKGFFSPEGPFEGHRMGPGGFDRPFLPPAPPHGLVLRQKSIGAPEEDKPFLAPPSGKFSRSLSVPGSDDIPPPPTTSPPEPPYSTPPPPSLGGATPRGGPGGGPWRLYNLGSRGGAGGGGGPPKPLRRKGPLVKQTKVGKGGAGGPGGGVPGAGGGEKSSIAIPTIVVKAPSTSSSGRSSRGSSVEAEGGSGGPPDGPPPSGGGPSSGGGSPHPPPPTLDFTSQFGAALVGAARREWGGDARRRSTLFLSTEEEEEGGGGGVAGPPPRLRHSKSIDEGMFAGEVFPPRGYRGGKGSGGSAFSSVAAPLHPTAPPTPAAPLRPGAAALHPASAPAAGCKGLVALQAATMPLQSAGPGAALSSGLAALQSGLGPLQPGAAALQAGIAALQSGLAPLPAGTAPLQSGLASLQPLQAGVAALQSSLAAALQPAGGSLQPGVSPLQPGVSSLQSGVSSLQSGVSPLQSGVSPLQPGIAPLQPGLAPLQPGLAPLQSGVSPLQTGVSSLQSGVSPLQTGVSSLQTGVSSLQTGVSPLQSGVSPLQLGTASLQTGVSPLQTGVSPLQSATTSLQKAPSSLPPAPHPKPLPPGSPRRSSRPPSPAEPWVPPPPPPSSSSSSSEARLELRVRFAEAGGLLALPPPAPSVDGDEELLLAEPLPPPLEFANSFEGPEGPPVGDSTASSLTSYDSEVATLTQGAPESRRGGAGGASGLPEGAEVVTDSGIEEVDSRSSSDHPPEGGEGPPPYAPLGEGSERARARGRGGPRGGEGRRPEPWDEGGRGGIAAAWPRAGGDAPFAGDRAGAPGRHRLPDPAAPPPPPTKAPPSAALFPNWPPPKAGALGGLGGAGGELDVRPPLRRAPSPATLPSERRGSPAPRPASLPTLPAAPLYAGFFDLRGGPAAFGELPPTRSLSPTRPPPPDKPFGAKPLAFWSKFDVADWLEYLNLGEHRARFLHNEIDGTHLPSLTKEDYIDLGVTRVGHRMNIDRALKLFLER
ncbi:LOW QUALITY PROTEIN: SH3 and multiple ankyrin repeat domains protein 1-like, partial [Phalacrocorax carbo]|uniref:LOW QUALITY PROTEIN: SH3 and multiple ankyrin repeat domains protein 1-like n=1 Tax=Phalacrocorax carbo TaxID=9209 RepID=UPI003119194E